MAEEKALEAVQDHEAGAGTAGKLCSICQTPIMAGERIVDCLHCALPFHTDCWKENRGCSAYGCKGAPPTLKPQTGAAQLSSNAWTGDKPCPDCGRTIKANALKCRYCGASFASRDIISKKEYSKREYEGAEYDSVRNKCFALFLLSAAGCLAPLSLVIAGILVVRKDLLGINYNRLPSALKALVLCSIGVSCLMIFTCLLLIAFDSN